VDSSFRFGLCLRFLSGFAFGLYRRLGFLASPSRLLLEFPHLGLRPRFLLLARLALRFLAGPALHLFALADPGFGARLGFGALARVGLLTRLRPGFL
jgi:hypothetical protein